MFLNDKNAAINRQLEKSVISSKLIHSFSNTEGVFITGPGEMEISGEVPFNSHKTLKVTYPHMIFPVPNVDRNYDCTRIRLDFNKEDWSEYNRISFWMYPEKNGFDYPHALMEYRSEGEQTFPNRNFLSGCHSFPLIAGQWNHIIWEIPELPRDAVTMFQINFVANGMQRNMKLHSVAYISDLKIEKVEADKYMGWNTDEDRISFCHSGYAPDDIMTAVTSLFGDREFYILEDGSNNPVFTGKTQILENELGKFNILDFSSFKTEGTYYIKYNNISTPSFKISQNHWEGVMDKIRNFFYKERCGCCIEDIHLACHLNEYTQHPDGRRLSVAGGWHDAADLSQGLCNTAEAVHSFIDAALAIKDQNPELSKELLNEARYGAEWLLSTRFEDGYRCVWNTCGKWTLGYTDGEDSFTKHAERHPFECLCAAAAEAVCFNAYKDTDSIFADYCLKCAKEDFFFALQDIDFDNPLLLHNSLSVVAVQLYAEASFAASILYGITNDNKYLDYAVKFADYVMSCQQKDPTDWDIPFCGFFYENNEKTTPLNYDHRAHDQVLIMCIAQLLKIAPEHSNATKWTDSLKLYRNYIMKLAKFSKPYNQIPAGIYFENAPCTLSGTGDHKKNRFADEKYINQLRSGVKLSDGVYLRRMPVVLTFRGSYGIQMSRAKAISVLSHALNDNKLLEIAKQQVAWILGNNPFCRSFMYGEGYDYPNMASPSNSCDVVGEIPVGMQSFEDTDIPYMPMTNQATYFEVWVHPASRMLWTLADL